FSRSAPCRRLRAGRRRGPDVPRWRVTPMKLQAGLMKCVAKAVVKYGGNIVGGGIAGNLVYDIWEGWEKARKSEGEKKAELEALAQQPAAKLKDDLALVLQEVAPNQPPEVRQALEMYLQQIPAMVRRSLKRPADAQGHSVPAHMKLSKPEDLLNFLPSQMPRFQPGQRPLPGVDLELQELLGVGGFGEVW